MNFSKAYHKKLINEFSDVNLILEDPSKTINMNLHKIILAYSSEYFYKLFLFGEHENNYKIKVGDADVARNLIESFYGTESSIPNYPKWKYILEIFRLKNYFFIENNVRELYGLDVPAEGFDLLVEVLMPYDLSTDARLLRLLKKIFQWPLKNIY